MIAYYNEHDPKAAAWLRELIKAGHIHDGIVDERSIKDVQPADLRDFIQCHFFCGIAGWPLALQLAGWPADRAVWTGSCPCQPFSTGNTEAAGVLDPRHLWPDWFRLIRERRPSSIFGEQVAPAIGKGWMDEVQGDLESIHYAVGKAVLPACSTARTDHERKRLWWFAHAGRQGWQGCEQIECFPVSAPTPLTIDRNPLIGARMALDGYTPNLLSYDGLSVGMARSVLHGFGNAIVPQVAAEFILACQEAMNQAPLPTP